MTTQKRIRGPASLDATPITVRRRLDCIVEPNKQKAVDWTTALGLTSTDAVVVTDVMTQMRFP
jgi:hypothetical protein